MVEEIKYAHEWAKNWKVPDGRHPWQWAETAFKIKGSPISDTFNASLTSWLKEPLEVFPDNRYEEETIAGCVQGGKSLILVIAGLWAIEFAPGAMMFNSQTDEDAQKFSMEKFRPSLETCAAIASRLPTDRTKNTACYVSFPDMFLLIHAANKNNLQSTTTRYQFNDEVYLWKIGLQESRDRCTRFWNRRILNVSVMGDADTDMDLAYRAGDMREWCMECPSCKQLLKPITSLDDFKAMIRFDGCKREDGTWDLERVKKETRLVCDKCGVRHEHTDANHKSMNAGAKYVATNKNPKPKNVSFRFNALCLMPSEYSWGDMAVQFLEAMALYKNGYDVALHEFVIKRLVLAWEAAKTFFKPTDVSNSDYALETFDIGVRKFYDPEFRVLTIDRQLEHKWGISRIFNDAGESRLIWEGYLRNDGEIREMQLDLEVEDDCVALDCSYERQEVYELCCAYGWRCMEGSERKSFLHKVDGVWRPYSEVTEHEPFRFRLGVPRVYQSARRIFWSNPTIKDFHHRLRMGDGVYFGTPRDVSKTYLKQQDGEIKKKVANPKTGRIEEMWVKAGKAGDHMKDCNEMAIVYAMCKGVLAGEAPSLDSPEEARVREFAKAFKPAG